VEELTAGSVALLVATAWCALAVRFGPRWGFVDMPDGSLKTHTGAAVPLGGVGVLAGFLAALGISGQFSAYLAGAAAFVLVVGLIDDRWGLSPESRLISATLAGTLLSLSQTSIGWGLVLVAATVVCINAVNLLDGLDALAGSTTGVTLAAFGWLAASRDEPEWSVPLLAAAAIAGFLIWNLPPARVFLGDNGAYVAGVVLVACAFLVSADGAELAVALAMIGAPLFDLGVTVLRRFRAGIALFAGDRDHTYDRLRDRTASTAGASGIFAVAQLGWVALLIVVEALTSATIALTVAIVVGLIAVGSASRSANRS
jgi:UDP-GlcNAc:undecaprenyl-phosphate/decaprenyl-phosphate GlcNAc-1-phosphate transferase